MGKKQLLSIKMFFSAGCITLFVLFSACAPEKHNPTSQTTQLAREISKSSKVIFKGQDLVGVGPFDVIGDYAKNQVIIREHRFTIALPYATDWIFSLTRYNVFLAESRQLDLVASVSVHPIQERVSRIRYLLAQQHEQEKRIKISDARIESTEEPPYLIYKVLGRTDIWWVLQSERLQVFRLHISTSEMDDTKIVQLLERLQPMVSNGFKIKE